MRVRYSTKHTISLSIVFLLLFSLVPSQVAYASTVETRYMRSDTQLINGLTAYKLGTAQSASVLSAATLAKTPAVEATLRPTSDSSVGFPYIYPTTPTTHYDKVDEAIPNDSTDYINTGDEHLVVKTDKYNKGSFTLPSGKKIAGVLISARVYTEYVTSARQGRAWIGVDIGGTNYMSGLLQTLDAWQTKTYWFEKNPATGLAWTQADVNNAKIVVQGASYLYGGYYYWMFCSTVWLDVYTYTDDTVYYSISVWKRDSGGTETPIASNIAQYSSLISALHDAAGLKNAAEDVSLTSMVSTDSIVVRVYQKVGTGSWSLAQTWTTEQLGAQSLDAATWTVYYYLRITASTSVVNSEFLFGLGSYDSKIIYFTWTTAPSGAWHDVSTWTASLVTKTWSSVTSWAANLIARTWSSGVLWTENLQTRIWVDIAKLPTTNTSAFYITTVENDGDMYSWNMSYTVAHEVPYFVDDYSNAVIAGQRQSGSFYSVYRTFLKFNTSTIPLGATVKSASLSLYGTYDLSDDDFIMNLQKWTGDTPITLDDFNQFDGINYDDGNYNSSNYIDNAYNTVTISNFDLIMKSGNTLICVRSSKDISSTVPTQNEALRFASFGFPYEEGHIPKLIVTWEVANLNLLTRQYLTVASWLFDFGTRIWVDAATWTYNWVTMAWQNITWLFYLETSIWKDITTWGFNIFTLGWQTVAYWVFDLPTRLWSMIAAWNFGLLTKTWQDIASFSFTLLTRLWQDITSWVLSLTTMQWFNISIWQFSLIVRQWIGIETFFFSISGLGWHLVTVWNAVLTSVITRSGLLLVGIMLGVILSLGFVRLLGVKRRRRTQTGGEMLYRLSYRIRKKGSFQSWLCL